MDVVINGEHKTIKGGTLLELLKELELDPRAVVVEHNRRIVRRVGLGDATVTDGDSIELERVHLPRDAGVTIQADQRTTMSQKTP